MHQAGILVGLLEALLDCELPLVMCSPCLAILIRFISPHLIR